jgi:hypothetical protein
MSALRVETMSKVKKAPRVSPCLFCHNISWEQKRERALGQEKGETLQADLNKKAGLVCCHCQASFCKPCLQKMFLKAILDPQDPWAHSVAVFLNDGLPQPSFTGSCCEFRVKLQSISKLSKPGCMQVQAPSQASSQVPSYDGYLLYPQYNLLVESNFNAIGILALGEQQGLNSGVLHGVVQPEDALNYQQEGVVASGSGLLLLDSFEMTLQFDNPMNGGATEKVLVKVIIVNHSTEGECDKGSHPTAADI